MRGRHLIMLVTAAAMAATGCGGGGADSSPAGAVRAYNDAVADGDGERACGHLDAAAQEELRQSTQGQARQSCEQAIEVLSDFYDDATKERLRDARVTASAEGDRAAARLSSPAGFGGPDREQTLELRRTDGEWKIVSLGLAIEPPPPAP
jgi:hypothetical protein